MRLAEKYIFFYALAILLSGLLLMGIGVEWIEVYYAVYLIEFLIAIELVAPFRQSLQRNLRPFIIVFLAGFLYIVVERILQILV
jgi:hypothetical protein